jgi:hypothetical protein
MGGTGRGRSLSLRLGDLTVEKAYIPPYYTENVHQYLPLVVQDTHKISVPPVRDVVVVDHSVGDLDILKLRAPRKGRTEAEWSLAGV